ncbi:hypothetical protein IWW36_001166 [Coemansia brasiliensis]|uniref:F-box domain-containing protein n=1 Tax=Coemansia brasiliensis TaxID=2650707 RepID=A0A9W8M1U7_9FUNG|nr:hypothetical protein IWW36_001166 [Coemansia brasiliensis]
MEPQEPEDEQCTCPAFATLGEHTPTCMLYTPISAMDIPEWQRRSNGSSGLYGRSRPSSYMSYGTGPCIGGNSQYPLLSNVSSVAESFASTSSILDSMAATETESLASYTIKRSVSVCSFSSAASSSCVLPTELLREIFKFLAMEDLRTVAQVSRQWRSAGNPLLWRTMVFPLDKRRLAGMKPVLSSMGHHVRRVVITPPLLDSQSSRGGSSRRVSTSNSRGWSLSRSGSMSQHNRPDSREQVGMPIDQSIPPSSLNSTDTSAPASGSAPRASLASSPQSTAATVGSIVSGINHSGISSMLPSPLNQPSQSQFPPPSPMSPSSPRQRATSNATTPLADTSASATPSTLSGAGRRQSRASMAASPSPLLPPVYAVPIPGTPGPGNVISDSLPLSESGSSWGAGGLGGMNIPSLPSASSSSRPSNALGYIHEVSEGTVLRMHQFMERFCPNVLEAVIRNPNGISSHSRRLGILIRLFKSYPRIERLDLSDFIMWDPQPLQTASEHLRQLRSLDVTNRVELGDVDLLPIIENCHRLSQLRIRATNATDSTIYAIIRNLSETLVSLNVGGCPVSSAAMTELVTTCKKLQVLQMWSCLRLDDSFLLALDPAILTKLQVLDMMDVQKFSVGAVQKTFAQKHWPYIKYLRMRAKCSAEDFAGIPQRAVLKLNSMTILD